MKKMEMEEEGFIPVGLDMGYDKAGFEDEKESKGKINSLFVLYFLSKRLILIEK